MTELRVGDRGQRAVGEAQGDHEVLLEQGLVAQRTRRRPPPEAGRPTIQDDQVDEVADLAEQTSALAAVLVPVGVRQAAGAHPVVQDERAPAGAERPPRLGRPRRCAGG